MARKTYNGISPIKVPENEKVVSIAFPSEASSITSLDIPETATIDVTACNDDFVWGVLNDTTKPNKKITANNKIYYTATEKVIPYKTSALPTINSNEFSNGNGVIIFATDVTSIGGQAFLGCSGLTSITIPEGVTSIDYGVFSGCSGITSITIPDSVTSIGSGVFYSCSGLTSVSIGNGVTSIGSGAFSGCSGLTSITIPDSVTSIDGGAFPNHLSNLQDGIKFNGTIAEFKAKGFSRFSLGIQCTDGVYMWD